MTREDKLKGFNYCMYMILGSYFNNARCTTKYLEKKCRLQYCELGPNKQGDNEERCINYLDRNVFSIFPKPLMKVDVDLLFRQYNSCSAEIQARSDMFIIRIFLEDDGKRISIQSEILYHLENIRSKYGIRSSVKASSKSMV